MNKEYEAYQVESPSPWDLIRILACLPEGRGEVLSAVGSTGDRLLLTPRFARSFAPPTYLITHPLDVRDVWVSNADRLNKVGTSYDTLRYFAGNGVAFMPSGSEWKARQKLMGPHIQPSAIPNLENIITLCTDELLGSLNPDGRDTTEISNFYRQAKILGFRLVTNVFLSRDADTQEASLVMDCLNTMNDFLSMNTLLGGLPWLLYKRGLLPNRTLYEAADRALKQYGQNVINAGANQNSELMRVLTHVGYEGSNVLSDEAIRDEVLTLMFTGFSSTAAAIAWSVYFLSKPEFSEYQDRIRTEVSSGINHTHSPTARKVVSESMRLYPPVYMTTRKITEDTDIDNMRGKLHLPEGANVLISPYITHRNETYWPDPESFDPERFNEKPADGSYLAFGIGPRKCIGEHYAMMVAAQVIGNILENLELTLIHEPKPVFRSILRPSDDFTVRATKLQ